MFKVADLLEYINIYTHIIASWKFDSEILNSGQNIFIIHTK